MLRSEVLRLKQVRDLVLEVEVKVLIVVSGA
jgi:hypothetical protein